MQERTVSDRAIQYIPLSSPPPSLDAFYFCKHWHFREMFSKFPSLLVAEMSFRVKSVSHDERREILTLILANTGFKNIHTEIRR